MQEMNIALKECKFGRFHIRLLASGLFGMVANVLVSNNTAYLLPIAECDLKMNLVKKGLLNAVPYIGMLFSSIVAGFLTDTFGRKKFLLGGYGGIFICALIEGSSQTYEVLVTAKFFEGLLFGSCFSAMVSLTSEFCHPGIRDRVMLCQSSFSALAQIIVAAFSWLILTQDWYKTFWNGYFVLNTWNFYLYFCSLWSLISLILYATLPESPKFLLSKGRYDDAMKVLMVVYKENTGKPADMYPAASLWKHFSIEETSKGNTKTGFKNELMSGLYNIKPMFRKPLVLYLILICSMSFLSMLTYNVLRLWFPQLSTIIEHHNVENNRTEDLCVMLDKYTVDLNQRVQVTNSSECVPTKSGDETYVNSIIMGCVGLLPYLFSGVLINRVGKKLLLFVAAIITATSILGLRWSSSKIAFVAFFSTNVALSQLIIGLLQTVMVEFFPTTARTLAISTMMMSGRVGTLVGNVAFPILLSMSCVIPFFVLAGVMIVVTVMTLMLPSTKK